MSKWKGLMKILQVRHMDASGRVLYEEEGIKNIIHYSGEQLILNILFAGSSVPANYYIGLDSRTSLTASSEISVVSGFEPTSNSYERQAVDSQNFSVIESEAGWQANSPVITFRASGGSWGPVKNIFMASGVGYSTPSVIISSASLSREITVSDGQIVTMRMAMTLSDG